ncbi:MAG: hypothetical protein ACI4CY_01285 [Candidatus Gastranaerophilaceae bacterium]
MAELQAACDKLSIEYVAETTDSGAADTEAELTAKIKAFTYTQTALDKCNKTHLFTICDVLEITYDANATNKELCALILAQGA